MSSQFFSTSQQCKTYFFDWVNLHFFFAGRKYCSLSCTHFWHAVRHDIHYRNSTPNPALIPFDGTIEQMQSGADTLAQSSIA